ncbi:MFS transporter [Rhizocola hellebori]|uniref:MFS transporter n=1 Tax=Rhizocola hellebori TaxID=1392758 RepID=A0A8J3QHI8_9ACTN|nr:DHA2 family efflux MFS transporter permease subunit [Rhizocola hellebori]GIH10142.1 MFS transporter [Rhizocola hellebori]
MVALKKWYALAALVLCVLVIGLDGTILNVALATLAADLGASTGDLQWIVAAYLITLSALLLPAGLAGDRWGRKKLLLSGVALFGLASLLAAFAKDTTVLIAARAAMGVGAAIIMPLSMSFLPVIFPPQERSKAISIWSVGMALGLPLGPILGGWLLENYWWGSVLLINIPVVLVAFVAAAVLLPESKDPHAQKLDPLSVIFSVFGLGLLVYGVIEAPTRGWGSPVVLACLGFGIVLIGLFTLRNLRRAQPLVDLSLLGNRTFAWGTLATVLASLALMGLLFVLPLSLQAVTGLSALQTGIRLIPLILGLAVAGRLAPKVCAKLGAPTTIATGMLLLSGGFGLGTLIANTSIWLTVIGLGLGFAMVPAMDVVLATLPEHRSGAGSGLVQTLRQVAGAFAVAGLGSLLSSVYRAQLPADAPAAARESIVAAAALPDPALFEQAKHAFQAGMEAVLLTGAGAAMLGAILVALFLPRTPEPGVVRESEHDLARVA